MEKILLYNPAISTMNTGDEVIGESAKEYISILFPHSFRVEVSTHLPVSFRYMHMLRDIEMRFVCGTNLLKGDMLLGFRQWDISLFKAPVLGKSVLLGCGWWQYQKKVDLYSKILLHSVLSKEYLHSVRDEYTRMKLEECGIRNVINTGCPTMWKFTKEFCKKIPEKKATNVVTTLTDYMPDSIQDNKLIDILTKKYDTVYLWLQGINDYSYYTSIMKDSWNNIVIVEPGLANYDRILSENTDIEYIGTRLHAGIRALQHTKRAMIIAVDNRAIEKKKDFNLPVIARKDQEAIEDYIGGTYETNITIPEENIQRFLQQFIKSH